MNLNSQKMHQSLASDDNLRMTNRQSIQYRFISSLTIVVTIVMLVFSSIVISYITRSTQHDLEQQLDQLRKTGAI